MGLVQRLQDMANALKGEEGKISSYGDYEFEKALYDASMEIEVPNPKEYAQEKIDTYHRRHIQKVPVGNYKIVLKLDQDIEMELGTIDEKRNMKIAGSYKQLGKGTEVIVGRDGYFDRIGDKLRKSSQDTGWGRYVDRIQMVIKSDGNYVEIANVGKHDIALVPLDEDGKETRARYKKRHSDAGNSPLNKELVVALAVFVPVFLTLMAGYSAYDPQGYTGLVSLAGSTVSGTLFLSMSVILVYYLIDKYF